MLTYLLISYFLPLMNISKREVSRLASKKPDAALISKMSSRKNNNNRPTSIFSNIPNYLKNLYSSYCLPYLIKSFLFINVDLERALMQAQFSCHVREIEIL